MATEILFPELGESVHEGQVSKWLKKVGDPVKLDEPIVEIMTDKVNTELPSPATGTLVEITVPEGGDVEVFHRMGVIEEDPEKAKEMLKNGKAPVAEAVKPKEDRAAVSREEKEALTAPTSKGDGRRWYSPVVKAIARDNDVSEDELASIEGSGQGGRVNRKDIERYLKNRGAGKPVAAKPSKAPAAGPDQEVERLTGMRKMIADHMVRSSQIPAVSTLIEVDVTSLVKFREANKESFEKQNGVKLTYTPFFIKALSECLIEFPYVNSSVNEYEVTKNNVVHMGVAVALGEDGSGGLIVPVIRNCEAKSLVDLSHDLNNIAKKARSNWLEATDVQGGTFTLTNAGSYGATLGTPMINAPQAAIVGTYGITKRPVIVDDMIAVRHIMNVVLTYDHRVVDGMTAGRFLQSLKKKLEGFDFYK